jgi:hypothetical protein
MNWGKSILAAFIFFAIFIFVLVAICLRENISLVSKDYYKEEINYQQQIERLNNVEHLKQKPRIKVVGTNLEVFFNQLASVDRGEVKLFRPSDESFDTTFSFQAQQDSVLRFDVANLLSGMYRAKMQWTMDDKEYYVEEIINR